MLGKLFNNQENSGVDVTYGGDNATYRANTNLNAALRNTPIINSDLASLNRTIQNSFTQQGTQGLAGMFIGEGRRA